MKPLQGKQKIYASIALFINATNEVHSSLIQCASS